MSELNNTYNNNLLEEYKLCQDSVQKIESTIWSTTGLIGLGSIGSLTTASLSHNNSFILIIGLSPVIISLTWIWWGMARRWWSIQHITFLRMRHLEESLKFYKQRYITYKDQSINPKQDKPFIKSFKKDLVPKYVNDLNELENYSKWGVQSCLNFFPPVITSWAAYMVILQIYTGRATTMQTFGTIDLTPTILKILAAVIFVGGLGLGLLLGFIISRCYKLKEYKFIQENKK